VTAVALDENEHFESVVEMLRSQVPGLLVTELPNGEIRLRIRGDQQTLRTDDESNQPLLVIDGMSILPSGIRGALRGLNPRDVESIQVLKDVSSTAIYGSRAANGVILIQLKR
jgi:TonB-dependent SusC/RagA subfamily outer membrane receptor